MRLRWNPIPIPPRKPNGEDRAASAAQLILAAIAPRRSIPTACRRAFRSSSATRRAERFSYYGMRAILVVFMMHYVVNTSGQLATVPEAEAREYYHWFMTAVYFFPMLGSLLSDGAVGQISHDHLRCRLVYCLGHLALALDESWRGLTIGLGLIAIGSGGIKPCVSAHVGDQFGGRNEHLIEKVFGWFYISINFGSFFSTLWIPQLLEDLWAERRLWRARAC